MPSVNLAVKRLGLLTYTSIDNSTQLDIIVQKITFWTNCIKKVITTSVGQLWPRIRYGLGTLAIVEDLVDDVP